MQTKTKSWWAAGISVGSALYIYFVRTDMVVGHFTFWDNFTEKILPHLAQAWALMTAERLAWLCFVGGLASLAWLNFGDWMKRPLVWPGLLAICI